MQDNKLKIEKLENNPNEEITSGRRANRENRNYMPRDDNDEIVCRIKVDPSTFDDVHNPKVFSDWLADMDYYFDWYRISEERKVRLAKMGLTGSVRVYWTSIERLCGE